MISDLNRPFRLTLEQYYDKIIIEKDHSDVPLSEVMEMVRGLLIAAGYAAESVNEYFSE